MILPQIKKLILFMLIPGILGNFMFLAGKPDLENLIIISVDTLRADHLGCYGYPRNTSPIVDEFSRDAIRFSRCYTLTPLTSPAFSTMLTSLPPFKHGSKRNGLSIYEHVKTLPGILREYGYLSTAYISNWSLRKKLCGLDREFDHYYEVFSRKRWMGILNVEGEAKYVTQRAIRWLENHSRQRIFLWVHYSEPHAPYIRHKGFRFPADSKTKSVYPVGTDYSKIEKYDSEIAFTDYQIGLLITRIKQLGIYEPSLIVFNGDHGESFGEHHYFRHGRQLYDSCLHVPLIVKLPHNRYAHTTRNEPVSMLDVSPTILSILGIPVPKFMEGWPLFPRSSQEPIFFETYKGTSLIKKSVKFRLKVAPIRYAILEGSVKLIYSEKSKKIEMYDLKNDRFEARDIYREGGKKVSKLKSMLLKQIEKIKATIKYSRKTHKQKNNLSREDINKLKSLGYIE